ncbi:hypothetical protein [Aneurinibacillus danicus]|jgi:hypothetical protein|uniref:Uncharacterized protein n=1 Tax=Aneurinibacillus danicus TaxID=267746 RepID=A0A511VF54_9BACL|nr:hypothetical protein [Aneurinibacillus danicus]GEN36588.1 hypothetical protein ADA01nite_40480 [Aneurinibacillus danicus]
MSYYDNQEAKVNLMHALVKNGWKVFGYKPDQSDMMVDYWSPAHWNGIAEKDGFVLVVDNRTTSYSGHKVVERNYKQSAINQDRIRAKQSESETIKEVYPTFQHGNPRGCNWHIEKDGAIVDKGTGIFSCYQANDRKKQEAIIEKFVSRFEKAIRSAAELVAEEVKQVVKVTKPVEIERKSFQVGDLVKFDWLNGFYKVQKIDIYGDKLAYFFIRLGKKYQELKANGKNNFYITAKNIERYIEQESAKLFELREVEEVTSKTVYKKAKRKQQQSSNASVMSITGEIATDSEDAEISTRPGVTVTLNEKKNGIEVYFDSKPALEVLAQLKAYGFRWFRPKKSWITKQTPKRLEFVQSLEPAQEKVVESVESSIADTSADYSLINPRLTDAQQAVLDVRLSKPNVKPLRLFQDKDGYAILECMNTSLETPYPFCFMWDKDGNQKRAGAAEKFNLEEFTLIREYQSTQSQSIENGTIFSHPDLTSKQNGYISKRLAHWQKTGVGVPVRLYKSAQYDWALLECIHRDGKTMYMRIFNGYADFIYNFRFINRDSFIPIHDFTTVEQEVIQCTV